MRFFPSVMFPAVAVLAASVSVAGATRGASRRVQRPIWGPEPAVFNSFADSADGWEFTGGEWRIEDGRLVVRAAPEGWNALAYSVDAPFLGEQRVAATVIPRKRSTGGGWNFAGITVFADSSNLWLLALTEGPNGERYIDFIESLNGVWQAQNGTGTRLERVTEKDTHVRWEYGRAYRLFLELRRDKVVARVTDLEAGGRVVAAVSYRLGGAPAVTAGAPGLIVRGTEAAFADFEVRAPLRPAPGAVDIAVEHGPAGDLAVFRDDLPGTDLGATDRLVKALRKAGFGVTCLTGEAAADPRVLTPERFFLYVVPHSVVYPAAAFRALTLYLRRHGNLLTIGGPPFTDPVWQHDGEWVNRAIIGARVRGQKPRHRVFAFDRGDGVKGWSRSTDDRSVASGIEIEDVGSPHGRVLKVWTADLPGWNTYYSPQLPALYGKGDDLLCFYARGDAATPQLAVEVDEADGARWIATVPLGPDWRYVVLAPEDFGYWPDSKAGDTRGGPGDRLKCADARQLCFGLTHSHTPRVGRGPHTFWIDDIGSARSPFGDTLARALESLPSIETLYPSYKTYPLRGISSVRMTPGQALLPRIGGLSTPTDAISCIPRPHGAGFGYSRKWRWAPLIEAVDVSGERRGTLLWLLVNRRFPYRGAVFAGCGLRNQAEATSPAMIEALTAVVRRVRAGVFLLEGGTDRFSRRPGESVALGAEVMNASERQTVAEVRFRVRSAGSGNVVFERAGRLPLAPRRSGVFSTDWIPGRSVRGDCIVETELRVAGRVVDRITHDFGLLGDDASDKDEFVRVRGSEFVVGGKVWRPVGINYWPLYVSGMDPGDYSAGWLRPAYYDPQEIERDLALMERLGMNMVSIQLGGLDGVSNLEDFLRRCGRHGIRVNGFLPGASPLAFDEAQVKEFLRRSHLVANPVLYAYDIIWEPGNWVFRGDARRRWDRDWEKWIGERYGSVADAEKDWGFRAPRNASGRVAGPTNRQLREDGEWRVMIAAYRRFMDDLMSRKWGRAVRALRRLDPNHLISFRQGNTLPQDFTFTATPKHIDFICPEGYSIPNSEEGYNVAGFITRYVHFTTRGKPIVWSEFGTSVWDRRRMRPDPDAYVRQAAYHELFYRMVLEAGANGTAPWWWPGGYRVGERSDFGVVNPDGSPRPAAELLRKYSSRIQAVRPHMEAREWLSVDRDAHPGGYWYLAFHAGKDAYARARRTGKGLGIRTAGTGSTSVNTPLVAVGNTLCNGRNPPKYLDAEFNWIEVQDVSGKWLEAGDGSVVRVEPGVPVRARISVGNIQEATWVPPAEAGGKPGGVYLASAVGSDVQVRLALPARTVYLADADFGEVVLTPGVNRRSRVALHMTAAGRTGFGEVRTFTLLPARR
ncbi:MAG: hypothetical protein GXP31_17885 [Kiritimatiellaeota bacterium]|nr:hypothetical protein [Kiritimatiellota bacterium]